MFFLVAALSLVASTLALQVEDPSETVRSSSPVTITWTSTDSDPVFSIELVNSVFNNQFAIANNVDPSLGNVTLTLPQIPSGDGYTIQFVNITNINDIFTQTSSFSVEDLISSSVTASSASTVTGTTTAISSSRTLAGPSSLGSSGTGSATSSDSAPSGSNSQDAAVGLGSSAAAGVAAGILAWLTL